MDTQIYQMSYITVSEGSEMIAWLCWINVLKLEKQ